MILTCPECSAKYMVASDTIGLKGRDVRCAKCGHMWHQKSERDSLDDLINRIQSEELDEIAFGDEERKAKKEKTAHPKKSVKELLGSLVDRISVLPILIKSKLRLNLKSKINFKLNLPQFIPAQNLGKMMKGAAAGIVLFGIVAGSTILARGLIMEHFPASESVFSALGMKNEIPQDLNIEDMLAFDHLSYQAEKNGEATLSGTLINLTSDEVSIPPVTIEILSDKNKVLWSNRIELTSQSIEKEGQVDFEVKLDKPPQTGAVRLELRFESEAGEKGTHSPAEEG